MTRRLAIVLLTLSAMSSGCTTNGTATLAHGSSARYVILPQRIHRQFGFPGFVRLVRFEPQRPQTSPPTAGATPEGRDRRSHARSAPPTPASADRWLFRQAPERYLAQIFTARTRLLAQHRLQTLGIAGRAFYSPAAQHWIVFLNRSYASADDARQGAGPLTTARDGDLIIQRVAQLRQWRCRNRSQLPDQAAASLDALCP